jgi:hypothetical protein
MKKSEPLPVTAEKRKGPESEKHKLKWQIIRVNVNEKNNHTNASHGRPDGLPVARRYRM